MKNQQQDAALAAANSVNAQQQDALAQQTVKLAAQDTTIAALNATVSDQNNKLAASAAALAAMEARLAALETAPPPPVPIDTADDLPLGEDDGDILTTAAGDPLVGDDKLD